MSGVRGRHAATGVVGGDALDQAALVRLPRNNRPSPGEKFDSRAIFGVEPERCLPLALVRPVTCKTLVRQDGANISVEVGSASRERERKEQERPRKWQHHPTRIIRPIGFQWDGASGPAIDTPSFMRASLVHDALYKLAREGMLPDGWRLPADKVLVAILRKDGMSWIRRKWVCGAVRGFGGWGLFGIRHTEAIHTAP